MSKIIDFLKTVDPQHEIKKFDEIVSDIYISGNRDDIVNLLYILDDNSKCDEAMFTIVHTIETLPDADYSNLIISKSSELYTLCPIWMKILLVRIINNEECFRAFQTCYREFNLPENHALNCALHEISISNQHFEQRITSLKKMNS